jgi:hypothetical protein
MYRSYKLVCCFKTCDEAGTLLYLVDAVSRFSNNQQRSYRLGAGIASRPT